MIASLVFFGEDRREGLGAEPKTVYYLIQNSGRTARVDAPQPTDRLSTTRPLAFDPSEIGHSDQGRADITLFR